METFKPFWKTRVTVAPGSNGLGTTMTVAVSAAIGTPPTVPFDAVVRRPALSNGDPTNTTATIVTITAIDSGTGVVSSMVRDQGGASSFAIGIGDEVYQYIGSFFLNNNWIVHNPDPSAVQACIDAVDGPSKIIWNPLTVPEFGSGDQILVNKDDIDLSYEGPEILGPDPGITIEGLIKVSRGGVGSSINLAQNAPENQGFIELTSVAGFVAGDIVEIVDSNSVQVSKIAIGGVSSPYLSFVDTLEETFLTASSAYARRFTDPVKRVRISGFRINGQDNNTSWGIYVNFAEDCIVEDNYVHNMECAIILYDGYNNRTHNNFAEKCGETTGAGTCDISIQRQGAFSGFGDRSFDATGFGPELIYCPHAKWFNLDITKTTYRGFKLHRSTNPQLGFINISLAGTTGFSVSGGSRKGQVSNLSVIGSNHEGIWHSGENNDGWQYLNSKAHVNGITNAGSSISFSATDDNNTMINTICDSITDGGSGNRIMKRSGADSVADGGTITHSNIAFTPKVIKVTGTVSGEMIAVTATSTSTFTVAIKKHDGSAGTTQTVYWEVEY